ncbi:zinc ABC transporter substrate-binding protein [Candidatus Sumerlaeota bacterium]|nr:zinc ABC transporter substrate-binding protein [Candidatus Sumerlaeota bacterium]
MITFTRLSSLIALISLVFACDQEPVEVRDAEAPLKAVVSILPQAGLVERIGGKRVEVTVLVQPGQSPTLFEFTPRQMESLAGADLYFRIGLPFEDALLSRLEATFPSVTVVDMRDGIAMRSMEGGGSHGEETADHHHGAADPHIWLDPLNVETAAGTVARALSEFTPAHGEEFMANLRSLETEANALNATLAERLAPFRGQVLCVFHPAYGYFADRFGLEQMAIEEGSSESGMRHLDELITTLRERGVTVIFIQPQFSTRQAQTLADMIGAEVIALDPLPRDPLEGIAAIGEAVARSFEGEGEPRG